eukprot:TRINITY_DN10973_c0_g1_i2.p1 TRINITY_DN10973_c0_g1~~TRINITY_DN10973_c0_g1_i2.p1  ORF type:complete len:215 (+),score=78.52 TRINITY_DN10973_c0_g1_i2:657-1301(+)
MRKSETSEPAEHSEDSDSEVDEYSDEEPTEQDELDLGQDISQEANLVVSKLRASAHELRSFRMVHRSASGKLKRRLARKTEKLEKLESRLEDPDKIEFMRKINRELAEAQRRLLNLQYTFTTMESEVQELEWQESKGGEELAAVEKQHKKLSAESAIRKSEEKETLEELATGHKDLERTTASNNHYFGEDLEECEMEELEKMRDTIKKTLAALS